MTTGARLEIPTRVHGGGRACRASALAGPGHLAFLFARLGLGGLRPRAGSRVVVGEEPPPAAPSAPQPARRAYDHEHDARLQHERRRRAERIREEPIQRKEEDEENDEENDEDNAGAHKITFDRASRRRIIRHDGAVFGQDSR